MGHASGTETAEKACRYGWCIAEVGQNPLNYNFLAALRRPSLMCRHKPHCAHRRGPSATCLGFARFRRIFGGFLPVSPLSSVSLLYRRNPPQARATSGQKRAGNGSESRHESVPRKARRLRKQRRLDSGGPIRVWRPSPALRAPNSPYGELARPGVSSPCRFAQAINQDEVPAVKPILKSNKLANVCYDIRGPSSKRRSRWRKKASTSSS